MSLESYIRAAPKAELHVHLEGSIQPATLLKLAARNHASLPADTEAGLRAWFSFRDFRHFIEVYVALSRCLKTADDYALITTELAASLAAQNARYAEVTFSPSTHALTLGLPHDVYFSGLCRGRELARRDYGVEINWIFDIIRNVRDPGHAEHTTQAAIDGIADGVVALGLGGFEAGNHPEPFQPWFDRAREAGLHSVPHAGETAGPQSVWGALRALGAERIGHGVRAIEDPALVAHLAAARVPLELCPHSEVCLQVFPSLEAHPLRQLYDAGVPITISSDDPPLFGTTLTDDLLTLPRTFSFSADRVSEVDDVLLNAVRYSFLPSARKQALLAEMEAALADLKPAHL